MSSTCPIPCPAQAFFGAAGELLLYSPHVKADYAPFLSHHLPSAAAIRRFFDALYFGTVPEAVALLRSSPRQFSRIRSVAAWQPCVNGRRLVRRSSDFGLVPVKAAPFGRYLKASGAPLRHHGMAVPLSDTMAWRCPSPTPWHGSAPL